MLSLSTFFIAGVPANVAHQQIDEAVVVVVEKDCSGRMGAEIEARCLGDVLEVPMPVIFEQRIAAKDGSDE